jgi:hypothetical protein
MKYTHAVWFVAVPLLAACSDKLTAPASVKLSSLTPAAAQGANHERPFGGRCDTDLTISPPLAGDAPNVLRLHIEYACQLTDLGRTTAIAEQVVTFTGPTSGTATNSTIYTASNGDQLFVTWTGTSTNVGVIHSFSGPETIIGGTGRFTGAYGSTWVSGFANVATLTGQFTSTGTISY